MQRCEQGERMSLYLDDLLNPEEVRDLQAHLARCEDCRQMWEAMCWMSSQLKEEPAVAPAPDLAQRVTARILERETRRRRFYSSIGVLFGSVGLWATAGLALLLLLVLVWRPSPQVVVFDLAIPLLKSVLSTLLVLGRACWSVVQAVLTQEAPPQLLAYGVLALALTMLWTRVVFRRWGSVTGSVES
jgi:predicted anti-sigma-YlaC factor YlaD